MLLLLRKAMCWKADGGGVRLPSPDSWLGCCRGRAAGIGLGMQQQRLRLKASVSELEAIDVSGGEGEDNQFSAPGQLLQATVDNSISQHTQSCCACAFPLPDPILSCPVQSYPVLSSPILILPAT